MKLFLYSVSLGISVAWTLYMASLVGWTVILAGFFVAIVAHVFCKLAEVS